MKLTANGLLKLSEIRGALQASTQPVPQSDLLPVGISVNDLKQEDGRNFNDAPMSTSGNEENTAEGFPSVITDTSSLKFIFSEYLEKFTSNLRDPCVTSLPLFYSQIRSLITAENQDNVGVVSDLLIQNHVEFLKALLHPNWHWKSLLEDDATGDFVLKDIVANSTDAECTVLLLRITLKLFCIVVQEPDGPLRDEFMTLLVEVTKIREFATAFLWVFLRLVESEEILPYFAGGVCTIRTFSSDSTNIEKFIYKENSRSLSIPSVLQARPEPRTIKPKPRIGTSQEKPLKVKLEARTISATHAATNVCLAVETIFLCCEKIRSKVDKDLSLPVPVKQESPAKALLQDSPDSPTGAHQDISPASPPSEATGTCSESPASPESAEMTDSLPAPEEKVPNRFRVEFKDSATKISLISPDEPVANEQPAFLLLKNSLHGLGGWYWLAVCLIDIFKPEEQDKSISWPEFQTVAFFNRNVHIVRAFRRNPVWMKVLDLASYSDAFVYYSPILRPVYISLCTHWETSQESPVASRNKFAFEQTLWMIKCLGRGKMLHEPYCFLGSIIEFLAPHEISSIFASLWKVIKTYLPNPHGLLVIPESEQDLRARQMAETDCLLKIRAVCFSRLPQMKSLARRFFMSPRVPLEESLWYESVQSQETASAPAPIDATHLARVD